MTVLHIGLTKEEFEKIITALNQVSLEKTVYC